MLTAMHPPARAHEVRFSLVKAEAVEDKNLASSAKANGLRTTRRALLQLFANHLRQFANVKIGPA